MFSSDQYSSYSGSYELPTPPVKSQRFCVQLASDKGCQVSLKGISGAIRSLYFQSVTVAPSTFTAVTRVRIPSGTPTF